jgi:uncharacterized protein YjbJ (UPF0337 family)
MGSDRKDQKMNNDIFEGNWKQFKGEIQSTWGKLTNDQLDQIEGNRTKLLGAIQEQYGITKDEAEKQLDELEKKAA